MCNSIFVIFISFFAILLTTNAQSRCQNEPNGSQLPMSNSRTTYLVCLNGLENIRNCPNGREFDPFDRRCLSITSITGTRSISASRTQTQDLCLNHQDGTYISDPTAENKFIRCEGGTSLSGDCPLNQNFNPKTSLCENQPRPMPTRVSNSTRVFRSTTPRSSFPNNIVRPAPPRPSLNNPYKSPLIQQSGISPY
ncbi:uncharacterized protein [Chironomus tepperi]|uniref:uncharacterized protein n=1 Tax=Chironomus tepperi TaxID=113505 RepID=UPI00391EE7E0